MDDVRVQPFLNDRLRRQAMSEHVQVSKPKEKAATNTTVNSLNHSQPTPDSANQLLQMQVAKRAIFQLFADNARFMQRMEASKEQEEPVQLQSENHTGMPDSLKAGVESLSGLSMDGVRVRYNSDQPAKLGALAYTQGTDIHVAPGQEKHLPHEAWHVVQQAQGRVWPTFMMKGMGGVGVNDDAGLEREADVMGGRALGIQFGRVLSPEPKVYFGRGTFPSVPVLVNSSINKKHNPKCIMQCVKGDRFVIIESSFSGGLECIQEEYAHATAKPSSATRKVPQNAKAGEVYIEDEEGVLLLVKGEEGEKRGKIDVPVSDPKPAKSSDIYEYRQTEFGRLMFDLGFTSLEDGENFRLLMSLEKLVVISIDGLRAFIKGTRNLRNPDTQGNVEKTFQTMKKWLISAGFKGRPKPENLLRSPKLFFGERPNHFIRIDSFINGEIEFTIFTRDPQKRRIIGEGLGLICDNGRSLFARVMAYYGDLIRTIKAKWVSTNPELMENLRTYNAELAKGNSPIQAALKTFTGKMAIEFGFLIVEGPTEIENGISFRFIKPPPLPPPDESGM